MQSLINRFKEFRRTKVIRKPSSSEPSNSSSCSIKPSTSLLKSPEVPSGEDDVSFQRHINQIKQNWLKKEEEIRVLSMA